VVYSRELTNSNLAGRHSGKKTASWGFVAFIPYLHWRLWTSLDTNRNHLSCHSSSAIAAYCCTSLSSVVEFAADITG
jgi:hypothetical protein